MRITLAILLACACLQLSGPAYGEEDTAQDAPNAQNAKVTRLAPVTVTAQKREENIQDIPGTVSTLSETAIEDASIESTQDIQYQVSNMLTARAGSRGYFSRISVRGISNTGIGDPGVAMYIDDIPYSGIYIFTVPLYDLERIEVLKGPQGTLYGKNTEGGAINIITRKPGNKFGGQVHAETGSHGYARFNGDLNIPLIEDMLSFRVSGLKSKRNGYVYNITRDEHVDDEDTSSIRTSLHYTPTERLQMDFNLSVTSTDDGGFPLAPMDKERYTAATGLDINDFEVGSDYKGNSYSEDVFSALRIKYEADAFDALSVSGYRSNDNELTMDGDMTQVPMYIGFNGRHGQSFSQELRVMSKPEHTAFKWLLGAFYGYETQDATAGYMYDEAIATMYNVPLYSEEKMSATLNAQDAALFGQGTLRFFDEALGLTFGLRYDVAHREMNDRKHTYPGASEALTMDNQQKTFTEFLPKLALDYKITERIMGYGSYARGFKAGGFSYAVDDPDLAQYDPEFSDAFEVGLKSEFPETGLRLNVAGFFTMIDDYQDRVQITPTTIIQANAAEATSYGFELESVYDFAPSWSLISNFGYTHITYGDYENEMTGTNYEGNRVALIPEYDLGITLQYRSELGLMARFETHQMGKTYMNRSNTVSQSDYTLFNLKAGYEADTWDVYVVIDNIANEAYFVDSYEDENLGFIGTVGTPRTIRLMGTYRF